MTTRAMRDDAERRHDEAIEDSFPASDPPAQSGVVGPRGQHAHGRTAPHKRGDESRPKGTRTDERHATETAPVWEDQAHPSHRR